MVLGADIVHGIITPTSFRTLGRERFSLALSIRPRRAKARGHPLWLTLSSSVWRPLHTSDTSAAHNRFAWLRSVEWNSHTLSRSCWARREPPPDWSFRPSFSSSAPTRQRHVTGSPAAKSVGNVASDPLGGCGRKAACKNDFVASCVTKETVRRLCGRLMESTRELNRGLESALGQAKLWVRVRKRLQDRVRNFGCDGGRDAEA